MGIIFVSQTGDGILGNIWLLCGYAFIYCTGGKLTHTDLILKNLILANCLVLLYRGIPLTKVALGMKYFLDDLGCKLIFYLHRMARGASLGTTCILSGFQAITISPSRPQWIELKANASKYIRFSIYHTLHMLVNSIVPLYITDTRESQNHTERKDLEATQRILILVSTFFSCNSLSSFFTFYLACCDKSSWWLVNTSALITACFPTLSPFVLISTDPCVSRLCFPAGQNKQFP
ncbi:hypothetical protein HPG69_007255 [Diceros bicornis minor]|uniref:Vomeronasal type-1 receptor n=1 Tax=Diceros bicornis minor TaxID=77932 RepID=A0A7J7FN62_DICBM|nr:hypothetical protein HPG69_007255 [Diceros bicornis minor]